MQTRARSRRCPRAIAIVTAAFVVVALTIPVTAGAATREQKTSARACDAFADYFTIEFLVAFAGAFAGLGEELGEDSGNGGDGGGDGGSDVTKEDIENTFHLIFSPKLEAITATLAEDAPKSIRKLFAEQQAVFAEGVDILRGAGLTKKQVEALAELDLEPDTDVTEVLGDIKLTEQEIKAGAEEFGKFADDLDLNKATPAQQRAFQKTGSSCGVFPEADIDCETLVSADLTTRLLGGEAAVENDDGSCTYTGPTGADGDEPVLIVDVYPSTLTFDRLVNQFDEAQQLDDGSFITDGFSSFSSIKTCGRTIYTKADGDTVTAALCPPDDAEVADDDLIAVRDAVVEARSG